MSYEMNDTYSDLLVLFERIYIPGPESLDFARTMNFQIRSLIRSGVCTII